MVRCTCHYKAYLPLPKRVGDVIGGHLTGGMTPGAEHAPENLPMGIMFADIQHTSKDKDIRNVAINTGSIIPDNEFPENNLKISPMYPTNTSHVSKNDRPICRG